MAKFDAIVIGGGHNGLVTAGYLARSGRRVVLVEARPELGGLAGTLPGPDGASLVVGAQDLSSFEPQIVRDLRLNLQVARPPVPLLSLLPDGGALALWRDPQRAAAAIGALSPPDATAYPRFADQMNRQAAVLREMLHRTPPNLPLSGWGDGLRAAAGWAGVAWRLRRMGARPMIELIRRLPMDAARMLEEWFENDPLRGALATGGIVGRMQGPRSSGTGLMLLYQSLGGFPRGASFVRGGIGGLIAELKRAAIGFGAEIRTGARVDRILTDDQAAVGVELEGGEKLRARCVASSADPRHTLFDLVGAPELELRVVRRLRNLRFRGSTARVNLVVGGLPQFRGIADPELLGGHIVWAPGLDYLERAYDDAKYGRSSAHLHLSMTLPTLHTADGWDPGGVHLLSVDARYTPYRLASGSWDDQREMLGDRVLELLAELAPGLPGRVVHRQVLTPVDYEVRFGAGEGGIHHGQMALDQLLFMRPIPGYADYRAPVDRLYFCGAGAHPGGGLTGMPGRNAARAIMKDLGRGRS